MEIERGDRKRRREFFVPHTKRPIDKKLIVVSKGTVGTTQVNTTLLTVTFPCTIVGLRWDFSIAADAGSANSFAYWCIQVVKDGLTTPTMGVSDGGDFVTPEQNVLTFGTSIANNGNWGNHVAGSTKTMRKLMGGDTVIFSLRSEGTNTCEFQGVVQFFCKS